jgi:hypothetical protein
MIPNTNRFARKALFLLFVLGVLALASPTKPARACYPNPWICLFDPPMHWDGCECVCDCTDLWGNCSYCN